VDSLFIYLYPRLQYNRSTGQKNNTRQKIRDPTKQKTGDKKNRTQDGDPRLGREFIIVAFRPAKVRVINAAFADGL
jgi:hypothetical protein